MSDELPPDDPHLRPDGVTDEAVEATGKMSEALEWVERARGHLYEFHQLMGHADLLLDEAVELLRSSGHEAQADRIEQELVGRNVIEGRWTFQIVEEFDDSYWRAFREEEQALRDQLVGGRRHIFESEMKEDRRSRGRRHHEGRPEPGT